MKYTTENDNAASSSSNNNTTTTQSAASESATQQQQQETAATTITTTSAANTAAATITTTTTEAAATAAATATNTSNLTTAAAAADSDEAPAQSATQLAAGATSATTTTTNALFCEQVSTVTSLFDKWNDCERTVVIYALLKRLRYPSLKFLQYSIDSNLTQNLGTCQTNLSSVLIDINANNASYLQNLLNAYKTCQQQQQQQQQQQSAGDFTDAMSSSSSDKDSMPCYGSDFQITSSCSSTSQRKQELLLEVLNMLPLLKPGNEEAKQTYMTLIPLAVKDTVQQLVPTELVQQIFSYLLIHPAINSEDRRSLNVWLRQLEDHIQTSKRSSNSSFYATPPPSLALPLPEQLQLQCNSHSDNSSSSSSSSLGNLTRNVDWQTIAPPSRQHYKQLPRQPGEWRGSVSGSCGSINPLCDNLNGITLNELASSQNSLGLSLGSNSSLVNGVVAGAAGSMLGLGGSDDHDTSFSKNGTEILDFEPPHCSDEQSSSISLSQQQPPSLLLQPPPPPPPPPAPYASILMGRVCDQFGDINRWSLDSKIAALKTRRSNSLTTQTLSSCSSNSSNSSVITVNDNCSNSTENLAQFANKPRSFSLSIEHHQRVNNILANSTSDTRLDDFKPSYIKFQTRNVGMSGIGLWLKSLRLHKYIELFKNMTYEEMLQISEEFLQSVGVTKGASHKLALCIEKLKERPHLLAKLEQELHTGQMKISSAVEELTNIVLTPMKPLESGLHSEENIGLRFLKVIELVGNALQQDPYCAQDDETLGVFMWILDRSIHNEAFVNHANQLKELKFKLSKLKMSMVPKLHHVKTTSGATGNINKPRWNGKSRKCDTKNGSIAGGPQQAQHLIFKPGQGVLSNSANENLQQQRKPSLNGLSSLNGSSGSLDQQPKKTMAAVVMDNFSMPTHDYKMNDFRSLEQLETLCRQMTEQAMN
ncbi:smg [Drosophila busckii]|uniref:Protein Smaug n=1 Tax=Drosophila busckii TaxID=30019 RepID=A0A0M3QW88_DROBS|nr:smg [Drosophila busckii]